jgi:hypothetical protein
MRLNPTPVLLVLSSLVLPACAQDTATAAPAAPSPAAVAEAAPVAPAVVPVPKDTSWKRELVGNFNIASSYYSDWAKGGQDNVAWNFKLQGRLERDDSDWNWTNTAHAQFGQVKLGDQAIRKTDDELKAETVLSRKLTNYVAPYVSASFQTQFAPGYQYPSDTVAPVAVSDWMDPLYMIQSAGVGSAPVEWLRTRVGAAVHETRTDVYRQWANDLPPKPQHRKAWKAEPGAEWVTELKKTVADKLLLQSVLATFTNFKGWDEATLDWTSTVSFQLTKYVNVNASGELRRDIQQIDDWQWKHQLSLGLNYSFL